MTLDEAAELSIGTNVKTTEKALRHNIHSSLMRGRFHLIGTFQGVTKQGNIKVKMTHRMMTEQYHPSFWEVV